ncbi:MAG: HAMP domain-containing histidine kinase [Acidobacteria bacterium]|nr:HAMP domain-containing histidine kinase [Acidobacteriota bacterium]
MAQKVIQIPTLNDRPYDFARLFGIWSEANDYFEDIRFDFSRCSFLRPNAVAFLGGLARLVESRKGSVIFDWGTLYNSWVRTTIRQNGFACAFGDAASPWNGTSIPYREDREFHPDEVADYLSNNWLGKGWVHTHVSEALKNAIVERVLELYVNAFEHSESQIGVFSCGQYFPQLNELHLTLVDFGMGIPANVRGYLKKIRPDLPAEKLKAGDCLKWAFQKMHTTKPDSTSRGVGLDLLKSFIRVNRGTMQVFSNDGFAKITADREIYDSFTPTFEGTVFHIKLVCDEKHYFLAGEAPLE